MARRLLNAVVGKVMAITDAHMSARRQRLAAGLTLVEISVAVGIAGIALALVSISFSSWTAQQRARSSARALSDLFILARTEAVRTGNHHVLYFGNPGATDPSGNPVEADGSWTPLLLINDGPPDTANCQIDGGETLTFVSPTQGLSWGVSAASAAIADDTGAAPFDPSGPPDWDGSTFADPSNTKANWVLFRPDGVPVGFTGSMSGCGTVGGLGTGGGGLYLTNGDRDYGVVLTPIGGVRVHRWVPDSGAWSG